MRAWGLCCLVLVAACYEAPSGLEPCAITCTDECPGDLTCSGGYCVEPGQVCRPSFTQVTAGTGFACAIDDLGALWCWGDNQHHVIDAGDQLQYPLATRIAGGPWSVIEGGGGHVCGISEGRLYCWGQNDHAQVGPVSGDVVNPFEIVITDGPTTWTAVSLSTAATCAIGAGTLYCWGADAHGSLGLGNGMQYRDIQEPTPVMTGLTDWAAIAVGINHSCGISTAAGVLCWGYSAYGQVGPAATQGDEPVPIVALSGAARAIAVAESASCAAMADGKLSCWGSNYYGELGENNQTVTTSTNTPSLATNVSGWTEIHGDASKFCGLAGDAVYCWGSEDNGGLGNGVWTETKRWAKVTTGASGISIGWNYTTDVITGGRSLSAELACALVGPDVMCWGDNRFGQLGTSAATMAVTPTEIAGGHLFDTLAVGDSHACGIENETLYCWGSTLVGAPAAMSTGAASPRTPCMAGLDCDIGTPKAITFLTSVDDVATGTGHTCALANDVISCWGSNGSSELGTPAPGPIRRTIAQPGGRAWTKLLPTGRTGQCATPGGGETWCWGAALVSHAMPTRDLALDNVKQIAVGERTMCVRDAMDKLACRGEATRGQFGTPMTGTCGDTNCNPNETQASCPADCGSGLLTPLKPKYTALAVSAYGAFACGVQPDLAVACWGANPRGQTGAVQPTSTMLLDPTFDPHVLPGLGGCTAVTAGTSHACALCDGKIWCWGDGQNGQLGSLPLPTAPVTLPRMIDLVLEGDPWIELASGTDFSCARSTAGHAYCWGLDGHAGLGNGGTAANLPVTVVATPPR